MGRRLRSGSTTIEAKTGYHLIRDGELAAVRVLRVLEGEPGMPRGGGPQVGPASVAVRLR